MLSEEDIKRAAIKFVKKRENFKKIVQEFADPEKIFPDTTPVSVFMAGSPGAGKTEFSKGLLKNLWDDNKSHVARIDADEIRNKLPGYTGGNAYLFQGAVSIAVEKIHDSVLTNEQNFILDGTLSNLEKAKDNIQRSLDKNRTIFIFYIYQDPVIAWEFTIRREEKDGRRILKETFIEQFIAARDVVNKLKEHFGKNITIYLVEKDFKHQTIQFKANINKIDNCIKFKYTKNQLEELLKSHETI
ncbi:MAG: zeta toxin family protein [Candidatus Pacebacteria bacterium]|nr:zeta toxin family protein [Candidatus Paceibacterota bacterium]